MVDILDDPNDLEYRIKIATNVIILCRKCLSVRLGKCMGRPNIKMLSYEYKDTH